MVQFADPIMLFLLALFVPAGIQASNVASRNGLPTLAAVSMIVLAMCCTILGAVSLARPFWVVGAEMTNISRYTLIACGGCGWIAWMLLLIYRPRKSN